MPNSLAPSGGGPSFNQFLIIVLIVAVFAFGVLLLFDTRPRGSQHDRPRTDTPSAPESTPPPQ